MDLEGSRKEFWAFVGRTQVRGAGIAALKNSSGLSVTSTKGKLDVLIKHYQRGSG